MTASWIEDDSNDSYLEDLRAAAEWIGADVAELRRVVEQR